MKLLTLLFLSVILASCTMPNDVQKEQIIQDANVAMAKEKTSQLQIQWKIDSLKTTQK